jgi:hypothetical protein
MRITALQLGVWISFFILLIGKIWGVTDLSWWWIFAPFWLVFLVLFVLYILIAILEKLEKNVGDT